MEGKEKVSFINLNFQKLKEKTSKARFFIDPYMKINRFRRLIAFLPLYKEVRKRTHTRLYVHSLVEAVCYARNLEYFFADFPVWFGWSV